MRTSFTAFFCALLSLSACHSLPVSPSSGPDGALFEPTLRDAPATDVFAAAGAHYGVPRDLLVALSWHETSLSPGDHDHDEHRPAHGWMGLSPERVIEAAALCGLDEEAIRSDREANIFAAAALLDALRVAHSPFADGQHADAAWWPVVVAWAQMEPEWLAHDFAKDVFATLQRGLRVTTVSGDWVEVGARELPGLLDVPFIYPPSSDSGSFSGSSDYPGTARFVGAHSSNFSSRSGTIRRVVLHTTEGSYAGAISWFQNPSASVSAHYVLRKSDGEVTQMVKEGKKAWHACSNNNDTVGIEHEGAASNPSTWTPSLLESSARLTAWLVQSYGIPIDRDHIVGHGEIQPASCSYRYDPGPHFPWDQYLGMVQDLVSGDGLASGGSGGSGSGSDSDSGSGSGDSTSGGGGGSGSSDSDDSSSGGSDASGETWGLPSVASVSFHTPRSGEEVGNPVVMRIARTGGHHVELWSGPLRIAYDLVANPVHMGYVFSTPGTHTVTAKNLSVAGTLLATDSVSFEVHNLEGTVQPQGLLLEGNTWRFTAGTTGDVAYLRYWVDGWGLSDSYTGEYKAFGAPYSLDYSFNSPGHGRLLVARSYDSEGEFVGEGFTYIDVPAGASTSGAIHAAEGWGIGDRIMRFGTEAELSVAWVEYWVNGEQLVDLATGATSAYPAEFLLYYRFETSGVKYLEVRAFGSSGTLVDTQSGVFIVPSLELELSWERVGASLFHFSAAAPAGTERVVIEVEGEVVADMVTGLDYAPGPYFELQALVPGSGERAIRATAYDPMGNVQGEWEGTLFL